MEYRGSVFFRFFRTSRAFSLAAVGIAALLVAGCPGNTGTQGTSKGASSGSNAGGFNSGNGADLPSSNSENFITVNDVVRSNADPNSMIELLGSSGEIGTQCPTTNDCSCVFNWTESSGILQEAEQTPALVETNMMRCLFTPVSADASFFDVRIRIKTADERSNSVRLFMSTQSPSLDASIAANYSMVKRYMCRDVLGAIKNGNTPITNTNFYGSGLIDPRLWTSEFSLAFNFYSTSFGLDYGAVATVNSSGTVTQVSGFECPLIPNDIAEQPIYDLRLYSIGEVNLNDPTNPNVVLGTGDNTIYPPDDNQRIQTSRCPTGEESTCEKFTLNRHDFYLASFKSGVFKQPFCPLHRVSNLVGAARDCTVDATKGAAIVGSSAVGADVIGFAAVPDANQRCPDVNTVKIPAGKKWAKLWQFRVSYQPRTIPDIANPDDIKDLFCTNREQECMSTSATNGGSTISVCYNAKTATGPKLGPQPANVARTGNCLTTGTVGDGRGDLASGDYTGFSPAPACVGTNTMGGATQFNCCLDLNQPLASGATNPSNRPANLTDGGDVCNPAMIGDNDASSSNVGAEGGLAQDIWLVGNGNKQACIEADTNAQGALKTTAFPPAKISNPFGELTPKQIDSDSPSDIVYVVTPESVKFEDMQDAENGAVARQYTPYRLKTDGVTKFVYRIDSDSNNSGDSSQRLSKFPLCILQDARKGASGAGL